MRPNVEVANAIGFPILAVALLALAIFFRNRYRKRLAAVIEKGTMAVPEAKIETDAQAYFQQKGELNKEERKLYELAAEVRRHEIGADGERCETLTAEKSDRRRSLQELRGEEHSTELEAPHE